MEKGTFAHYVGFTDRTFDIVVQTKSWALGFEALRECGVRPPFRLDVGTRAQAMKNACEMHPIHDGHDLDRVEKAGNPPAHYTHFVLGRCDESTDSGLKSRFILIKLRKGESFTDDDIPMKREALP